LRWLKKFIDVKSQVILICTNTCIHAYTLYSCTICAAHFMNMHRKMQKRTQNLRIFT